MNRAEWLIQQRHNLDDRYNRIWAPIYDENWGKTIDPVHQRFVSQLVNACPATGSILDAACGTGKYWPIILASGKRITGIDQSRAMLEIATRKYPQVRAKKIGLQELNFQEAFDLILCIDAMEMIFPEDWPKVLGNFHRALKQGGQLYFTVEIAAADAIERDYQAGISAGLPVVFGESVVNAGEGENGYHYYPSLDQVRQWIVDANLTIIEEDEASEYHHFWVQKI